MKKVTVLFIIISYCALTSVIAQTNKVPTAFGMSAGTYKHPTTGEELSINTGQLFVTSSDTLYDATMYIHLGLPLGVFYYGHTFGEKLFVSKGFYSDFILLRWTVVTKADQISRFEIYRRLLGSDTWNYTATVPSESSSWKDEYAEAGVMYEYKVYAAGINDVLERRYINFVTDIGYRSPTGTITGRITYEGGNAVENVQVIAETEDITPSNSMYFSGNSTWGKAGVEQFESLNEFTLQGFISFDEIQNSTIFQKENQFALEYIDGELVFSTGDDSVAVSYMPPVDTFFHVSAVHSEDNNQIYINGELLAQLNVTGTIPQDSSWLFLGRNGDPSEPLFFNGNLDEVRCWDIALDSSEIARSYSRYLSGNETGLVAYWTFNEGTGDYFFDFSRSGYTFNENHGEMVRTAWSDHIPKRNQLWFKGISDESGNYILSGLPYLTNGSTYRLAPLYENHEFSPANKVLFVGDDATTHNNVDFRDISSFTVTGNVVYEGTAFPVKDVYVMVDGNYVQGSNNQPVKTDELGNFSISVPISDHYISVERNGHEFVSSYYPGYDSLNDEPEYHTFIEPVSGIQFTDITKVKLAGLIVGGPVEAERNINSVTDPSVNNIGQVRVTLTTESNHVLNKATGSREVEFFSGDENGVYEVELLPEKYVVASDKPIQTTGPNGSYIFNRDEDLIAIDLTNAFMLLHEIDSVYRDTIISNKPVSLFEGVDTVASYHQRRDWIYRSTPSFEVLRDNGSPILCDSLLFYTDSLDVVDTVIVAENSGGNITYPFGKPVFRFLSEYSYIIEAFEQYLNCDSGDPDRVPITDGSVLITNELASIPELVEIPINQDGAAFYGFAGGVPNIASPYTKSLNFALQVPGQSPVSLDPINAYLLGSKPTGNNFVTTGPDVIDFILRDPPGSNSSAFLEKGTTITSEQSNSFTRSYGVTAGATVSLGPDITSESGTPVWAIETSVDITADAYAKFVFDGYNGKELFSSQSITFTEGYSTSDDPAYVGSDADVFIGHSTNITFGLCNNFALLDTSVVLSGYKTGITNGKYTLALNQGLYLSPSFNTSFIYTQYHIENELISNLKLLRNLMFTKYPDLYQPVFTDMDDEKFGTNNFDPLWGNEASDTAQYNVGPSYIYDALQDTVGIDSIFYFNSQILMWEGHLRNNEQWKTEATLDPNYKNISFDAGASYEGSSVIDSSSGTTSTFGCTFGADWGAALGFNYNGLGVVFEVDGFYRGARDDVTVNDTTKEKSVGFILSDGDQGDYYTIDVKKCPQANGPVFSTKGGQSSCPYEGAELTKYYNPGQTLSYATMQIEVPYLSVDNPVSPQLPETTPAIFKLGMANQSEVGADVMYMLYVDPATNPDGAKLYVDGMNLVEGVPVMVPGGETINKTLEFYKGNPDVDAYEGISVVMSSSCDDDVYSEIRLSAYFTPACVPVSITSPTDNWSVNVSQKDTLIVQVGGYDLQSDKFEDIYFQYRPTGTSMWFTTKVLVNDPALVNQDEVGDTIFMNNASSVNIIWDMTSLVDREYDIRAISHCDDGSVAASEILNGVLDGKRPKVFGTPEPADGILSAGEDISIQFNEPIETGLLVPYNFSVRSVLTNSPLSQNASVHFDGISKHMYLPESVSLNNKSFTIEFMVKSDDVSSGTILTQGTDASKSLEISFAEGQKLNIKIGSFSYEGQLEFTSSLPADAWQHYAVVFDMDNNKLLAYQNGEIILEVSNPDLHYEGKGRIYIAKPLEANQAYLEGNVSELRIWSVAKLQPDIIANKSTSLSGSEVGLYGYWQLNEAHGTVAEDKSSQRHATIIADWAISGERYSVEFNGTDQFVEMNTSNFAILAEMDYTLEFWFRNIVPSDTVCFFSCGRGDGNEGESFINRNLSICGLSTGEMVIFTKGHVLAVSDNALFDNQWHHFALVITKEGNALSIIDGEVHNQFASSQLASPAAAKMYLGSRKSWLQGQADNDYFFTGNIDEFRFWNMARGLDHINMDMNAKLMGDEMGLVAYYPFEHYVEDQFGQFNIETALVNKAEEYASDPAIFNAAESYSVLSPTIKDARPVQEITFDFTANNDQIIITPDPAFETYLENQIIEITVEGIEDKHGNMIASPKSWTAFVDMSQVKWQDKKLRFEKLVHEELDFISSITNRSGLIVNYSIENLPNWISADPQSGSIEPLESQEIHFTISSGLNIGSYFEDIYLQTDKGYTEKLILEVIVKNKEPDWAVDPAGYQHSMSVIGILKIDGEVSTDKNDLVAAFVGNECRGKAYVSFIESVNAYEVFLDIYSNDAAGETVHFKVWDASTGNILSEITPVIGFSANSLLGTPTSPVEIIAGISVQTMLELVQGWNWLSFNYESESLNIPAAILESLSVTDMDQVKAQDSYLQYSSTLGWYGSLTSFNNTSMYMGKFGRDNTLIYSGLPLDPEDHLISYREGWNWIGFTPDLILPVNDALSNYSAGINDVVKGKHSFSVYVDGIGWLGSLQTMEPGKGYMLQAQQDGSFYYQGSNPNKSELEPVFDLHDYNSFPYNMSIIAHVNFPDNLEPPDNETMTLNAYHGVNIHGRISEQSINGKDLYFLTIHGGSENMTVSFDLQNDKNDRFRIGEQIIYSRDRVLGTVESPVELNVFDVISTFDKLDDRINLSCYPNPFGDLITFSINSLRSQKAELSVYNGLGQKITILFSGNIVGGSHTVYWDATEFPSGIYYCKLRTEDTISTIKIIKTK